MSTKPPRPTGEVRTFSPDELIVSKTDLQGRITYANDTFLRVSAYREQDVVGRPHSIIRHPDTPRGLFHLLWETIRAGDEVFAYVNNLAADGASYWVLAHVTPSRDAAGAIVGYHSNRRAPDLGAVERVGALYEQMCAAERGAPGSRAAAEASRAVLDEHLAALGTTYDQFIWDIISTSGKAVA